MSATSGFFVIVCKHWGITNTSDESRTPLDELKVSLNISVRLSVLLMEEAGVPWYHILESNSQR